MKPLYRKVSKLAMVIAELWKEIYKRRAEQLKYWR